MNLILQVIIYILGAFLLLCIITYIDFQIWYRREKRNDRREKRNEYPIYRYGVDMAIPTQMYTGVINVAWQNGRLIKLS